MRRKDREMPEAFGWAVADKCEWAVLGLIDADGEVYPVPVTIVREGSRVYFHSAQSGEKVECLRRHPRVSLCCIGDTNRGAFGNFTTEYESAILRGQAAEVTNPEEKQRILRLLCERHTPELMEKFSSEVARSLGHTEYGALKPKPSQPNASGMTVPAWSSNTRERNRFYDTQDHYH